MKESIEGSAILDDVEEGTFIGFCEFAYRGAYTTPDRRAEDNDDGKNEVHQGRVHSEQTSDNPDAESSQLYAEHASGAEPELASAQEWALHRVLEPEAEEMPAQVWDSGASPEPEPSRVRMNCWDMYATKRDWISFNKKVAYGIPLPKAETRTTYIQYPYDGLWEQFRQLRFVGDEASISLTPDLVFHGKLYVFANRYLVDSLRTQCLKSLHRDLCEFSLNKQNVPHILDLLEYTYQESGRGEPDIGCSLRDLVIHYAACEARTLAENPRFGNILDRFSEMGSDLVRKIVN